MTTLTELNQEMREQIRDDFLKCQDRFGMISDDPQSRRVTGNGNVYTADAVVVMAKTGALNAYWRHYYLEVILNNEQPNAPGLFQRAPNGAFGHNSIDDYFALPLLSKYLDRGEFAGRILDHGFKTGGFFNTKEPGVFRWRSFFWRLPQLKAHTILCTGKNPGPWTGVLWAIALVVSLFKTGADGRTKGWQMARGVSDDNLFPYRVLAWIHRSLGPSIGKIRKDWGWKEAHPTIKWGQNV